MALIHCPECGKEISDTVKACPGCGFNIHKALKHTPENNEKRKRMRGKIAIALSIVLIFLLIGFSVLFLVIIKPRIDQKNAIKATYNDACKLLDDKSYDKAISEFEEIKSYNDVEEKLIQAHYLYGKELYEKEKYKSALAQFSDIEDYSDSSSYIEKCNELIEFQEKKDLLKEAFDNVSGVDTVTLSTDGLSLSIDSEDEYDFESFWAIEDVISTLELPDSLLDSMESTNALMGRQEKEYEDYTVSWSYHPDNGLDVIFEINE